MRKGDKRIFSDENNITLLRHYREGGFTSYSSIAKLLHCDQTSVHAACKRLGIKSRIPFTSRDLGKIISEVLSDPILSSKLKPTSSVKIICTMDGEKINRGRSYREYLK